MSIVKFVMLEFCTKQMSEVPGTVAAAPPTCPAPRFGEFMVDDGDSV